MVLAHGPDPLTSEGKGLGKFEGQCLVDGDGGFRVFKEIDHFASIGSRWREEQLPKEALGVGQSHAFADLSFIDLDVNTIHAKGIVDRIDLGDLLKVVGGVEYPECGLHDGFANGGSEGPVCAKFYVIVNVGEEPIPATGV